MFIDFIDISYLQFSDLEKPFALSFSVNDMVLLLRYAP